MSQSDRMRHRWSRTVITLYALVLLASPPADLLWGVTLGTSVDEVVSSFQPSGSPKDVSWTRADAQDVVELSYRCSSVSGCFSVPAAAQFYFLKGRLAAVTFQIQREQAPAEVNVNLALRANLSAADFQNPIATQALVGRRIQYFNRRGETLVWAQDGPDVDLKWYADKLAPVGIAEAVASGAQLPVEHYPSAAGYVAAHQAIVARDYPRATSALDTLLHDASASPILKREAKYVLAMVLAAEVKAKFSRPDPKSDAATKTARQKLKRAEQLAPALKSHLDSLRLSLGLQ